MNLRFNIPGQTSMVVMECLQLSGGQCVLGLFFADQTCRETLNFSATGSHGRRPRKARSIKQTSNLPLRNVDNFT